MPVFNCYTPTQNTAMIIMNYAEMIPSQVDVAHSNESFSRVYFGDVDPDSQLPLLHVRAKNRATELQHQLFLPTPCGVLVSTEHLNAVSSGYKRKAPTFSIPSLSSSLMWFPSVAWLSLVVIPSWAVTLRARQNPVHQSRSIPKGQGVTATFDSLTKNGTLDNVPVNGLPGLPGRVSIRSNHSCSYTHATVLCSMWST